MISIPLLGLLITILCISSAEACSWAYSLYSHCTWSTKNGVKDKRIQITYSSLSVFSVLSAIMSVAVWCGYIFMITATNLLPVCVIILFFLVLFFQMITIHAWYIVSMYVCVPFEYIPFISRYVIIALNTTLKDKNKIKYISLERWYEIFSPSKDKTLLINFLDVVPEYIWTKDIENKYTYVNKSFAKNLLFLKNKEIAIGKTTLEIAENHRTDGVIYSFGELCTDSDRLTKERRKLSLFYEYGLVDNEFISLRVLKCPIFDGNDKMIGIIGAARDITFHTVAHDNITNFIKKGDYEKAMTEFILYKNRFDSFKEYKDLDSFVGDIEHINN